MIIFRKILQHLSARFQISGFPAALLIIPLVLFFLSCSKPDNAQDALELDGFTMGTLYHIKINAQEFKEDSITIKKSIDDTLENINNLMSTYIPESEISKFNRNNTTDWVQISDELFEVIKTSLEISNASNGAFDITVGPLVNLWGFGPQDRPQHIPDDIVIRSTLEMVGYRHIQLDPNNKTLRKDQPDIYIDLSGIAKGYAVDRIASLLENQYSLKDYLIDIGGEIRARGINPEGRPWRIGIELPLPGERKAGPVIELVNTGMATSGDYRNFYEIKGVIYSHTIDPNTGRPVTHQLKSVSVIHPQSMVADAWATALLVSGPDIGLELANHFGLPALFIAGNSDGFEQLTSNQFSKFLPQ